MKDVAEFTRVTPNQRIGALRNYLNNIRNNKTAQQILADWGLYLEKGAVDLMARMIDPQTVCFGGEMKLRVENADWNNLVTRNKMLAPVDLNNWVLFYTKRDQT